MKSNRLKIRMLLQEFLLLMGLVVLSAVLFNQSAKPVINHEKISTPLSSSSAGSLGSIEAGHTDSDGSETSQQNEPDGSDGQSGTKNPALSLSEVSKVEGAEQEKSLPSTGEDPPSSTGENSSSSITGGGALAWNLVLVSEAFPLDSGWDSKLKTKALPNEIRVDERIYESLTQMLDAAKAKGHALVVCSGYRSIARQEELFDNKLQRCLADGKSEQDAYIAAKSEVALPGSSEHHTGLAVDIAPKSHQVLDDGMMGTKEVKWLYENCYKYGFIVRYPEGKTDVTGIIHEPWHYRYVGVEAATEIMQNNLTLEQHLGAV